jgi:phospholipid/cholesterol/gamma-HCH transport system substrate-binding protein
MLHYRGAHLLRPGLVGIVVMVCVILIGLQSQKFMAWGTTVRYQALFGEAAGLAVGDDVIVSGVRVGTVQKVVLHNGDALVVFSVNSTIRLGADSSAHIKTSSLLGKRDLTVVSAGTGRMRSLDTIPSSRTSSPYSLTDAVGDLSTKTSAIDIDSLNRSLDMLSSTLNQIAPQVGPAFDGLTQLSKTINSRNESLRQLLTGAGTVTSVLAQRSEQVNTLILNANALVDVLAQRRQEIVDLLANTSAVAKQLSGLVADNEAALGRSGLGSNVASEPTYAASASRSADNPVLRSPSGCERVSPRWWWAIRRWKRCAWVRSPRIRSARMSGGAWPS